MTTVTVGNPNGNPNQDVTIAVTISGGDDGGALAATSIYKASADFMKLDEVEIIHGLSTDILTIKNSRGSTLFQKTLVATANKIYGGHETLGIFPKMDDIWTIETDGFTANDEVTVYLKFTRFNG